MLLKLNKKGAMFHWIVFGFLIALGIFFLTSKTGFVKPNIKGEWAVNFLQGAYLEAEKDLLEQDIIIRKRGREVAALLSTQGGFGGGKVSSCALSDGVHQWNIKDSWCTPDITKSFDIMLSDSLKQDFPSRSYGSIGFDGSLIFGKGSKEIYESPFGIYEYRSDFAVGLEYSLIEYEEIEQAAKFLVRKCSSETTLQTCLQSSKPDHWKFGKCGQEGFVEKSRVVSFCASSPSLYTLPFSNGEKLVTYQLALDFTSDSGLQVEDLQVSYHLGNDLFTLSFAPDNTATSYGVYYTTWNVDGRSGTKGEVFGDVPQDEAFAIYGENTFTQPNSCNLQKEPGIGYLCDGKIDFIVKNPKLQGKKVYFAITTTKDGQESTIKKVIGVTGDNPIS